MTASVAGSIRETVPSWRFATQTAPSPNATLAGPLPTLIAFTTLPESGSMRTTLPLASLATHSAPAPAAIAVGLAPTAIRLRRLASREIDAGHHSVHRGRDPDGPERHGDAARRVADRDRPQDPVRVRVDLRHRAALGAGHPQRAAAERESGRVAADVDRRDLARIGVDPRHGAIVRVGHPHRPGADRGALGPRPTANCSESSPVSGSIRPTAFSAMAAGRSPSVSHAPRHGESRGEQQDAAERDQHTAAPAPAQDGHRCPAAGGAFDRRVLAEDRALELLQLGRRARARAPRRASRCASR